MKRTYLTLIIAMLVIGFAAIATNLVINGTINFGFNQNDFDSNVVFTYTNTMNGTATIQENGKAITFNTTKLENVNQQAIMDFDIANKSKQYDANVTIECGLEEKDKTYEDYLNIKYDLENSTFEIDSGDTKSIRLTITLTKAYNESLEKDIDMLCTIKATPEERDTEGTYTPKEHQYEEILLQGADPVLEATSVEGIALTAETTDKKLIPVIIEDNGKVKRADTTKKWYDYENQWWANAVILNDGIAEPDIDQEILEENIESYFVWIPKYRYKIFDMGNYNAYSETELSNKAKPIEIEFGIEDTKDTNTSCASPNESDQDGECNVGKWMTHPAFTKFEDIKGFWVGKFETGYRQDGEIENWTKAGAEHDESNPSKVIIKPNVYSWRKIVEINTFTTSYEYKRSYNSHLMMNTEWGAVAYLSHSNYGNCTNNICKEVRINNNTLYITGFSSAVEPKVGYDGYFVSTENNKFGETNPNQNSEFSYNYNDNNSVISSTTGNYSGIYDMSGGAWERMAGVMKNSDGTLPVTDNINYYNLYNYSANASTWNRRILGDATGEMGPFIRTTYEKQNRVVGSWYNDDGMYMWNSNNWVLRGGDKNSGTNAGLFSMIPFYDFADSNCTFRIVLSPQ